MWKQLILAVSCIRAASCESAPPSQATASVAMPGTCTPVARATIDQLTACARDLRRQGRLAAPEVRLYRALELKPGEPVKTRIKADIAAIGVVRQQLAQLDAVARLAELGQTKAAAAQLTAIATKVNDPQAAARYAWVADRVERQQRNPLPALWTLWSWFLAAVPFLGLILTAYFLRWLWAQFYWAKARDWDLRRPRPRQWRLTEVADETKRGVQSLIGHYFSHWSTTRGSAITSGLLLTEASAIPPYPSLDLGQDQFDISPQLESTDLTVGGVNVSKLFGVLPKLRDWFLPQPTAIKGFAYVDSEGRIYARLATRNQLKEHKKNDYIVAVSAFAEGCDEAAAHQVAEEVTFKMLYALSRDVESAAAADDLRDGLALLKSYLSGVPTAASTAWNSLEQARGLFEKVRMSQPDSLESHLYEGIALDLLERHEDAIAHFDYVKQLTTGVAGAEAEKRHDQAIYNGAVATLRNLYGLDNLNEAIRRLTEFIGDKPDFFGKPILALASATLADAWANRTIHWQTLKNSELKLPDAALEDEKLLAVINLHLTEVSQCIVSVEYELGSVRALLAEEKAKSAANRAAPGTSAPKTEWDEPMVRQTEWAISNAWADFYLYAATSLARLDAGRTAKFNKLGSVRESKEFKSYIEQAIAALRHCEMLLPAGVETLTNLGTVYQVRGWPSDLPIARQYFQRAIALNPHYEYAYYRLAQTWEADGWREKVIATLKACPAPPKIGKFRDMYALYYVEPRFEYAVQGDELPEQKSAVSGPVVVPPDKPAGP